VISARCAVEGREGCDTTRTAEVDGPERDVLDVYLESLHSR
jgi:hypothetical protein